MNEHTATSEQPSTAASQPSTAASQPSTPSRLTSHPPQPRSSPGVRLASDGPRLPSHKLLAYGVALDLVVAVRAASVRDAHLRDQALRAAKSCALNCAEGAARVTRPDKGRAFAIARGEAVEAAAAVEIAALCGDASSASAREVARLADRVVAMLTPLVR